MKFRSHSRLPSGLPMDWHERRTIGTTRDRHVGAHVWFFVGLLLGVVLALLMVASV